MAKVIFEFNDEEDRIEIENIIKRNDFKYALEKIKEYRRLLYKEYINNEIIVKDKKVIAEGNEILTLDGDIAGRKAYLPVSDVIDTLFEESIILPTQYEINEYQIMVDFIDTINNFEIKNNLQRLIQGNFVLSIILRV